MVPSMEVLINLIVCDGDPQRGNRESLLSTDLKYIGVANSKHSTYRYCTLIISCTKFDNTFDSNDYGFVGGTQVENRKVKTEDKTNKPKKVILKEKPREEEPPENEEEDVPQEDVISETRSEKIVEERGTKKRITKITRTMADGTKEIETIKEKVEDD